MACWATKGGRELGSPPERTPGGTAGGSLVALTSREKSGLGGTVGRAGRVLLRGVSSPSGMGEEVSLGRESARRGVDVAGVVAVSGRLVVGETGRGILEWLETFLSTGEAWITSDRESTIGRGDSWQRGDGANYFQVQILLLCVIFCLITARINY